MYLKPIPSGPAAPDGDDSSIALAISLSVRSCLGILFFLEQGICWKATVGGGGKSV